MSQRSARLLTLLAFASLGFGCFGSDRKPDRDDDGGGVPVPVRDGGRDGGGGDGDTCDALEIQVGNNDKVDLLFVVNNSGSMREEQAALRAQFQQLVTVLTTGDRDGDGTSDFPRATDLHLAVVSTDMGVVGISGIPNCDGFGDDGVMQTAGDTSIPGCAASFPPFLSFIPGASELDQTVTDLGCVATLGTEGCGFEQPLEAALKALWPAQDRGGNGAMDPNAEVMTSNRITFVGDKITGAGTTGHGDGANVGFLRNDPTVGLSVIAVVVMSDEDDCSSSDPRHFTPPQFLDPTDPLASQDLNLRCFFNPQNLYSVNRYVDGLRALRPGQEQHVMFAAIAGVPPDLVDSQALAGVNFADDASREAFYVELLEDPRMIEQPDPTLGPGSGNLMSSCTADVDGDGTPESKAYPPRRIVQVARGFGANGFVQSICQADFGPAMTAIIRQLAFRFGAP